MSGVGHVRLAEADVALHEKEFERVQLHDVSPSASTTVHSTGPRGADNPAARQPERDNSGPYVRRAANSLGPLG